ncbi:MAG: glutamate racemase [Rickettsiales bacterium]|jgi:glutamate racemase|nr:glutamate racemase [Rickettsiales bacterium]
MKIGVFDSGLGGLIIAQSLIRAMPAYDFAYLGDTANLPYGARSDEKIYERASACVDWLFKHQDCKIVIIACNTASIAALRRLQREYLPSNFPERRVLGIVIPTIEAAAERGYRRVGLVGTISTVRSRVYEQELAKLTHGAVELKSLATPLLVSLIENGGDNYAEAVLSDYLTGFKDAEALILGCTHYPRYKGLIRRMLPGLDVLSQDEILPEKITSYLMRHPEIERELGRLGARFFGITDMTENYISVARELFGAEIMVEKVAV